MKKALIILCLLVILPLKVEAKEYDVIDSVINITGENWKVYTPNDIYDKEDEIKNLGLNIDNIKSNFNNNTYLEAFYISSNNNNIDFKVEVVPGTKDADLDTYTNNELKELINSLDNKSCNYDIYNTRFKFLVCDINTTNIHMQSYYTSMFGYDYYFTFTKKSELTNEDTFNIETIVNNIMFNSNISYQSNTEVNDLTIFKIIFKYAVELLLVISVAHNIKKKKGTTNQTNPNSKLCSRCGTIINKEMSVCPKCGKNLK